MLLYNQKPEDTYIIRTKEDETCEDFLSFNKLIENKIAEKARLPLMDRLKELIDKD